MYIKPGKKYHEWKEARERLKVEYLSQGITRCEMCGSSWALSFHHLDKRSTGRAKHTFEDTRLLCIDCHREAEYDKMVNYKLKQLR